jgi:CRISPR system Cascade subunit CasE
MYLSKVRVNTNHTTARYLLELGAHNVYPAHQALWQLFRDETSRTFLFREELTASGMSEFYVLSKVAPIEHDAFTVQTKDFNPELKAQQRLSFRLRVNPTICITNSAGLSRRHDVLMHAKKNYLGRASASSTELEMSMHEAAHQWVGNDKRLQQWGVSLDALPEIVRYTQHRSMKRSGTKVQFSSVDFQGILTVNDPVAFMAQYEKGFGRAKAMGCGLMLIRKI